MMKITEKSDVYSYGIVVLEVLMSSSRALRPPPHTAMKIKIRRRPRRQRQWKVCFLKAITQAFLGRHCSTHLPLMPSWGSSNSFFYISNWEVCDLINLIMFQASFFLVFGVKMRRVDNCYHLLEKDKWYKVIVQFWLLGYVLKNNCVFSPGLKHQFTPCKIIVCSTC